MCLRFKSPIFSTINFSIQILVFKNKLIQFQAVFVGRATVDNKPRAGTVGDFKDGVLDVLHTHTRAERARERERGRECIHTQLTHPTHPPTHTCPHILEQQHERMHTTSEPVSLTVELQLSCLHKIHTHTCTVVTPYFEAKAG